jgi:hypothetical protein
VGVTKERNFETVVASREIRMYSLSAIADAIRNPRRGLRELNRLYHTRLRTRDFNPTAPNIFDEDWDNLLILDACRYDVFEETLTEFSLPGRVDAGYSRGASTTEFLRANFDGRDLSDTVYVTGTTMLYRNSVLQNSVDHNLHAVVDVWEDAIDVGEWGITPERMAKAAREAHEQYPNKRLIVHFIQPHIPFIGEFGEERFGHIEGSIWQQQRRGQLDASREELWRAYRENLQCALPSVRELLERLPGRTVVTADHGQLIGERLWPIPFTDYGHPSGTYCDELVKVPWHVNENGDRKRITADQPDAEYDQKGDDELDDKAEEHLRQLGYLQ